MTCSQVKRNCGLLQNHGGSCGGRSDGRPGCSVSVWSLSAPATLAILVHQFSTGGRSEVCLGQAVHLQLPLPSRLSSVRCGDQARDEGSARTQASALLSTLGESRSNFHRLSDVTVLMGPMEQSGHVGAWGTVH